MFYFKSFFFSLKLYPVKISLNQQIGDWMLSDRSPGPGAKLGQRLAKFGIGRTRLIDPGSLWQQVKVMTNFPWLPPTLVQFPPPEFNCLWPYGGSSKLGDPLLLKIFVALTYGTRVRPSNWYWHRGSKQRLLRINAMTLMSSIHSLIVCNSWH